MENIVVSSGPNSPKLDVDNITHNPEKFDVKNYENVLKDYPILKYNLTELAKKEEIPNKNNLVQVTKKDDKKRPPKDVKDLYLDRLIANVELKKNVKPAEEVSRTEKDIEVLKKIEQIRDLLEMSKQEPQTPKDFELYKKSEIAKRKYLNTLAHMQQRLKDIEYKYFTVPSIINRTMKTLKKPSKEPSISTNETKPHKKKVKVEEISSEGSSGPFDISLPKRTLPLDSKKHRISNDDVKYSDAFIPKREAPIPPLLFTKSNPNSKSQEKTVTEIRKDAKLQNKRLKDNEIINKPTTETKPNKGNISKKAQETFSINPKYKLNPEFANVSKHIEMLFANDPVHTDFRSNLEKLKSKTDKQRLGKDGNSYKKDYTLPLPIQKIKYPELFPTVPPKPPIEGVKHKAEKVIHTTGKEVGHPDKRITFRINRDVKKPEGFKTNKRPAHLAYDFIKQKDQIKSIFSEAKYNKPSKNTIPNGIQDMYCAFD